MLQVRFVVPMVPPVSSKCCSFAVYFYLATSCWDLKLVVAFDFNKSDIHVDTAR